MIESLWRCREVDNNKAKLFLTKYLKNYNPEDAQIKLKISHIYRVAELSKRLATMLNLSEEDILLAELIGLLHDIGRFEQIKNYHTFLDKESIDHAEYGNKILFEDDLIRNFITEDKYDEIIKTAISNHNKPCISNDLTNYERLHAMIIRDADKTDIPRDARTFCVSFAGYDKEKGHDDLIYIAVNTFWEDVTITLPDLHGRGAWHLNVNTYGDGNGKYCYPDEEAARIDHSFVMRPRSVAVFTGKDY